MYQTRPRTYKVADIADDVVHEGIVRVHCGFDFFHGSFQFVLGRGADDDVCIG